MAFWHGLGKTLDVIAMILTDSHSRQVDMTARETGVRGFDDQMLAGWMKSKTSVMGHRDLPLPAPSPEGWKQRNVLGLVSYNN